MADFPARIKPKKSSVAGETPSAVDLEVAEIAVNTADGKLFVKHTDGSIKEISGTGGGGGSSDVQVTQDLDDVASISAQPNQVLRYSAAELAPPEVSLRLTFESGTGPVDSSIYAGVASTLGSGSTSYVQPGLNGPTDFCMQLTGGQIGGCAIENGDQFELGADNFTVEAWIYIDEAIPTAGDIAFLVSQRSSYSDNHSFTFAIASSEASAPSILLVQGGQGNFQSNTIALQSQTWHHVAATKFGATLTFHFDGGFAGQLPLGNPAFASSTAPLVCGTANSASYLSVPVSQKIDMVRLSKTVFYPTDGSSFAPNPTYSGLLAGYYPQSLTVISMDDVEPRVESDSERWNNKQVGFGGSSGAWDTLTGAWYRAGGNSALAFSDNPSTGGSNSVSNSGYLSGIQAGDQVALEYQNGDSYILTAASSTAVSPLGQIGGYIIPLSNPSAEEIASIAESSWVRVQVRVGDTITDPASGDTLIWNSTLSKWEQTQYKIIRCGKFGSGW